ncbi:MAG: phage terminase large subunit [Eubacteriales bacterium]|nr:phage terminase large subunit [Eubacteriales bacterium]
MRITPPYTPTPKQRLFHQSTADEALYGGAAGGGKTKAIVMEALMRCLEYPGTAAYLFRRTYPELEDTLIGEACASIPEALGVYAHTRREWQLVNGSVMRFRACQNDADRFRYQGTEIQHLFFDELTHFSQPVYDYLKTRLRAPVRLACRPVVRCTANPGGAGHAWVKSHFVDGQPSGGVRQERVTSQYLQETRLRTVAYIPARAADNPHLSRDYLFELEQKPKALRDALLHGRWDAFEGQVFAEWVDDPAHYGDGVGTHVIEPFDIPEDWPRYRSFDFGFARPFSVGWWAVTPQQKVIRYREWYGGSNNVGVQLSPAQIAEQIRRSEEEHEPGLPVFGVADPSIWDGSRGEAIARQMEREGVFFTPGENARLAGKMQLHYRLRFDAQGRPGMYVFRTCRDFLRTVPALCYDAARVEDVDTAGEDHIYDETRYFLMCRPISAPKAPVKRRVYDPLAETASPGGIIMPR